MKKSDKTATEALLYLYYNIQYQLPSYEKHF